MNSKEVRAGSIIECINPSGKLISTRYVLVVLASSSRVVRVLSVRKSAISNKVTLEEDALPMPNDHYRIRP